MRGRAWAIAVVLLAGAVLWVRRTELIIHTCNLTESTPPVPALALTALVVGLSLFLRRLSPPWALTRREVIFIYFFVAVGSIMASLGVVRMILPLVAVPYYFATPENHFALLHPFLPSWIGPQGEEVLRTLYEGWENGPFPWQMWVRPVLLWTAFLTALFLVFLGLAIILRPQWTERERLPFPLVRLPLMLTADLDPAKGEESLFRSRGLWMGFALAMMFNVSNILHVFNPTVAALGRMFDLGSLFTERPWSGLRPLIFAYRPEVMGLGYLVSLEVLFSIWVCYLAQRLAGMIALMSGYERPGFPFEQTQGAGAYVAMALFLLWVARSHLRNIARSLRKAGSAEDSRRAYRWAMLSLLGGLAVVLAFARAAGMALGVAGMYFALILAFALTYARVRTETGTPSTWLFPFWEAKRLPLRALGSAWFEGQAGYRTLVGWSVLFFLSRGFFQSTLPYPLEGFEAADRVGLSRRAMAWGCLVAVGLGLLLAFAMHLQVFYQYGANVLESGTTAGGARTRLAIIEWSETANYRLAPRPPEPVYALAAGVGFLLCGMLLVGRTWLLRFPLHPLGYAMATAYGTQLWGPALLVWLIKAVVLHLGGVRLYQRLVPFFLGLALGHFFTMGVGWAFLGGWYPEQANVARVWFL